MTTTALRVIGRLGFSDPAGGLLPVVLLLLGPLRSCFLPREDRDISPLPCHVAHHSEAETVHGGCELTGLFFRHRRSLALVPSAVPVAERSDCLFRREDCRACTVKTSSGPMSTCLLAIHLYVQATSGYELKLWAGSYLLKGC